MRFKGIDSGYHSMIQCLFEVYQKMPCVYGLAHNVLESDCL